MNFLRLVFITLQVESFLQELKAKGILNNITNEDKVISALNKGDKFYVGFDPTANSLHLGNYVMLNFLKICDKYKIDYVVLIGGITGLIGDPSGKKSERVLLDKQLVEHNVNSITSQLKTILPNHTIINNADFYTNMHVLDFLRDIAKIINIKDLLGKESIRNRLDTGISLTEFIYSVIQANDFYELHQKYHVSVECGGSDQWSNITNGITFVNNKTNTPSDQSIISGFTLNLLLKADGNKFGKSEEGAVFINEPYKVYQFLLNQDDKELYKLLCFLTTYNIDEIKEIINIHQIDPSKKYGQEKLLENVMTNLYGLNGLTDIINISMAIFNKQTKWDEDKLTILTKYFPTYEVKEFDTIKNILLFNKIFPSYTQFNKMLTNKQIRINGSVFQDENKTIGQLTTNSSYLVVSFQNQIYVLKSNK